MDKDVGMAVAPKQNGDARKIIQAPENSQRITYLICQKLYQNQGLLLAFASAGCFAVSTVCIKALQGVVASNELVFIRVIIMLLLGVISTTYTGIDIKPQSSREAKCHLAHASLMTISWCCQIYAYHNMGTADVTAIVYSYVTFVGPLARIILKETFHLIDGVFLVFTVMGVVLIAQPSFIFGDSEENNATAENDSTKRIVPVLAAFTASVAAASAVIIVRLLGADMDVPSLRVTNYLAFLSSIFVSIVVTALGQWTIPDCIKSRLLCVMVGVATFMAIMLISRALSLDNALYIVLATLSEVYIVFIFDIIFFSLQPKWLNVLGIVCIVTSSAAVTIRQIVTAKQLDKVNEKAGKQSASQSIVTNDKSDNELITPDQIITVV